VHHSRPPGVQDREETLHHPGAGAEVPRQAGGGLPSHRQAEVPHSPGQGGQAGKHYCYFKLNFFYLCVNFLRKIKLQTLFFNAFEGRWL
jgi:hypothetical protein